MKGEKKAGGSLKGVDSQLVGEYKSYLNVLMLNESSLGRESGLSQGDSSQLVDAVGGVTELGGEIDGVGVVPLGQHADVSSDEGINVGGAETVASLGEMERRGWRGASSAG